ncbi:MAG TPA: hypothetical protein VGM84_01295 [Steroidobacteraceae bacterium]|jgi:hypothetical protein
MSAPSNSSDETLRREFEERSSVVLAESLTRIDSRIRSRLNQARQAAVAEVARSGKRPGFLRSFVLMPTAGAIAAAALVAMVLWQHPHSGSGAVGEGSAMTAEDLDLVADGEGLDLMEDLDGSFYEWAADQSEPGTETST